MAAWRFARLCSETLLGKVSTASSRFGLLSRKYSGNKLPLQVSAEVNKALQLKKPVVALESTIITHGMPFPQNLETALRVEEIVRSKGAVPATIAIIRGKICVGLEKAQLEDLASLREPCVKTSRRDFPYVLSQGLNGGTTVSGTMLVASKVGILIFVTGGIGGVHRGAESTLDISADLTELGRTPLAVVSSGIKSILDIGKTLEFLETQGVCVATFGQSRDFPAFFTSKSGFKSPYSVPNARQAARLILSNQQMQTGSGILIGVPIPEQSEAQGSVIEQAIQQALEEANSSNVAGKDVTPFLLKRVNEITKGASLKSNMALIENNAAVGAEIAVELSSIENSETFVPPAILSSPSKGQTSCANKKCVVVGGSIVDFVASVHEESIQMDSSTHRGSIRQSYGGVGRNLADGLSRLGSPPLFLTAVGSDDFGRKLVSHNPLMDTKGVRHVAGVSTATYVVVLDKRGDCQFGIGDMEVHNYLTKDWVRQFESDIIRSSLVVMDGNTPQETINDVLDLCNDAQVPIWYEPTDINKATKAIDSPSCRLLAYASPNLGELRRMAIATGYSSSNLPINLDEVSSIHDIMDQVLAMCRAVMERVHYLVITLGKLGLLVVKRGDFPLPVAPFLSGKTFNVEISWKYYPAQKLDSIVSVSGAGDCLAAGFIQGILLDWDQDKCAALGLKAAEYSLRASPAVPLSITPQLRNF